jgi:hypothetical protein
MVLFSWASRSGPLTVRTAPAGKTDHTPRFTASHSQCGGARTPTAGHPKSIAARATTLGGLRFARYTRELPVLDVVRVVALIVAGSACLRPGHRLGLIVVGVIALVDAPAMKLPIIHRDAAPPSLFYDFVLLLWGPVGAGGHCAARASYTSLKNSRIWLMSRLDRSATTWGVSAARATLISACRTARRFPRRSTTSGWAPST